MVSCTDMSALSKFLEAVARRQEAELPEGYHYEVDASIGFGFFVEANLGIKVLERPIVVPSGSFLQSSILVYAITTSDGILTLLQGALPPILPTTTKDPSFFTSRASLADNLGMSELVGEFCVSFYVPARLVSQVATQGRDIWIVRFDQDLVTPLLQAAKEGDGRRTRDVLLLGVEGGVCDDDGLSALMHAAIAGSAEACKAILQSKGDPNYQEPSASKTAMMFAAHAGHVDAVMEILYANGDATKVDSEGNTPLMWAATGNMVNVVEFLAAVCPKDTQNREGLTACGIAEKLGFAAVVDALR